MSGKWVVLEGMEGCGKGTLVMKLREHFEKTGQLDNVVFVREPGGTLFGEEVRKLLLADYHTRVNPLAEMLLFFAARTQLMDEVILPALAAGKLVISERNCVSSMVMQGLTDETEAQVGSLIGMVKDTFTVYPDLYLFLDIDLKTSLKRKAIRGQLDRIEQRDDAYFETVYDRYQKWAAEQFVWAGAEVIPTPVVKIDGALSREDVLSASVDALTELLN